MNGSLALVGALMFASSGWFGYALANVLIQRWQGERYGDVWPLLVVPACAIAGAEFGLRETNPLHLLSLSFIVVALIALVRCDVRLHSTPPWLSLIPLAGICAVALLQHAYAVPLTALLVCIPFAGVALATKGTGMSWSDVRVAALGASLLGLFPAVIAFSAAGLLLAFIQWGLRRHAPVQIVPYLVGATAVAALAFGG